MSDKKSPSIMVDGIVEKEGLLLCCAAESVSPRNTENKLLCRSSRPIVLYV
jgi:hypothetical protein